MLGRVRPFVCFSLAIGGFLVLASAPDSIHAAGPPVPEYATAVSADSPRGHWRFGDAAGSSVAVDASGNGLNGTYGTKVIVGDAVGTLLYDRNMAATFVGVAGYLVGNDYVSMGSPAGLNFGTGDFTVEAWISTEINADRPVVTKSSGSGARWEIVVTDDSGKEGRVRAYIFDGAPLPNDVMAYGPSLRVDDGEFHHVVVVFDRDFGVIVYVDGVGAQTSTAMSGSVSNTAPFRVGGRASVPAFNGEIDEVAVYPSALSAARVRTHYDAGLDPPEEYTAEALSDVPTGYWRLGEAVLAAPAADASGNGLNGTYGTFLAPGRPGALVGDTNTAVTFNGIDGVSMGDTAPLDFGTDDFSVSAWVKTAVNGERAIVGKVEQSATANWVVTVTDDTGQVGRVRAKIFDGSVTRIAYGPNLRVDDGGWHHVGVAFDRDVGISVYVDGVERVTSGLSIGSVSNAGVFAVGQAATYSSFQGDLDEVAVYGGVALDPTAFSTYYDGGATPSERILPLEDPTISDVGPSASLDDTPTILPGYDSTLIPSPRPGDRAAYEAAQVADWDAFVAAGEPEEPDPTVPGDATGVSIGPHAAGMEGVAWSPSDTTIAVGRTRVVQMVNQRIAVYTKSDLTRVAGEQELQGWVRPCIQGQTYRLADPQIMWDIETRRWYYVAVQVTPASQTDGCLAYGWSKGPSSTPLSDWCHFATPTTQRVDDYPKLGDNGVYLVVGSNRFYSAHQDAIISDSRIQVIKKPGRRPLNRCRSTDRWPGRTYTVPNQLDYPISPVPANGVNAQAAAWVVGIFQDENKLFLWRIREGTPNNRCGDGSVGPCFHKFEISLGDWPDFERPLRVPQPDPWAQYSLNALEGRLTQAVALWDPSISRLAVWTQHTVGIPPPAGNRRARVRWYEILPPHVPGASPTFHQRGPITKGQYWVFNAAISPAANGREAMIHYDWGGGDVPVKVTIAARARTSSTPLGKLGPEQEVHPSAYLSYRDSLCGGGLCGWGDYAGAAPDPRQARRIWATNQATREGWDPMSSPHPWTTRLFAGRATP